MIKIRVEIPYRDIMIRPAGVYSDAQSLEIWIMWRLKEAGIPIIGILLFAGVERGTLETWGEDRTYSRIYE